MSSPGAVHTSLGADDCAKFTPKFQSLADVHVVSPKAPAGSEFQVKLYGPPQGVADLGFPQIGPYDGSCTALLDIFGSVLHTTNTGGVYKVEVCGDLNVQKSCKSQNFKLEPAEEPEEPELGTLTVLKFYDANEDGLRNDPAPGDTDAQELTGWAFTVTDEEGDTFPWETPASLALEPGLYTVTELLPAEQNWLHSTSLSFDIEIVAGETTDVEFGNYCTSSPGGHTLGWWQNKNGEADMRTDLAGDLAALNALHLKNLQGADTDFAPGDYAGFKAWLKGAKGNPMAYMLSAQTASLVLAMRHGYTDNTVYVGLDGTDWLVAQDLVDRADALLAAFDPTKPDANKAEEARVKDWIDAVNNGRSFTQPTPDLCPFTF